MGVNSFRMVQIGMEHFTCRWIKPITFIRTNRPLPSPFKAIPRRNSWIIARPIRRYPFSKQNRHT